MRVFAILLVAVNFFVTQTEGRMLFSCFPEGEEVEDFDENTEYCHGT
jgi:hypothetical protein